MLCLHVGLGSLLTTNYCSSLELRCIASNFLYITVSKFANDTEKKLMWIQSYPFNTSVLMHFKCFHKKEDRVIGSENFK